MQVKLGFIPIIDFLCQSEMVSSKAEAKRLIKQGAVKMLNANIWVKLDLSDNVCDEDAIKCGKRQIKRLKLIDPIIANVEDLNEQEIQDFLKENEPELCD